MMRLNWNIFGEMFLNGQVLQLKMFLNGWVFGAQMFLNEWVSKSQESSYPWAKIPEYPPPGLQYYCKGIIVLKQAV